MRVLFKIILVVGLMIASFVMGAKLGVQEFYSLNAQHMAALSYVKLYQLNEGKVKDLEKSLQFDIDHELIMYIKGRDSEFSILWPELGLGDSPLYMKAIKYRNENPWPFLGIKDKSLIDELDVERINSDEELLHRYIHDVLE